MLSRVERDERPNPSSLLGALGVAHTEAIVPAVAEAELETPPLPHDHPKWVKDALTVSLRARELLARLKPVVIKILSFWDHRVRTAVIGDARVNIDQSGSYRIEN